ncbi:MAG: hypothetical protein OQK04_08015, partial [Kangiellaceae bacterium]|nr:hypothetical protein [Kangiellaceae bacterium]
EHPDFFYNINALYDYSDAQPDIEMSDIEEHSHFVAEHLYLRGKDYKLAMVATDTLSHALLQVYKLLISKTPVEAEVFNRRKDAILWLLSED